MKLTAKARATRGRPRTFDVEAALDRALKVFWEKGYQAASLDDLTRAMGINRPSLYAAFGDKEALFCKALHRYSEQRGEFLKDALTARTARAVAKQILDGVINLQTDPQNPRGCLTVKGSFSCDDAPQVRKQLAACRCATDTAITERFQRAVDEGDLPKDASPRVLTQYLSAVMQGLSIQSANGAARAELRRVAAIALAAFPTK